MKYVLRVLFLILIASISYGAYHRTSIDFATGERIIGFSVLSGVIFFLPLFLYHRWKGKRLQDYTLSEENLKKMREKR
ncbi:MAG: hypothetical protein PVK01_01725 [Flavobacteriaceae bacterium]|jgi:hypothetical protein